MKRGVSVWSVWSVAACLCLSAVLFGGATAQAQEWGVTQNGNTLEIAYGSGNNFPQYAALHLDSGYFRMVPSTNSSWGTSVILPPSLWEKTSSGEKYHQGGAVSYSKANKGADLVLTLSGKVAGLSFNGTVTISPPSGGVLSAQVAMTTSGSVSLASRDCEAFKPLMLSSMHVSSSKWAADEAFIGDQPYSIPTEGFIVFPFGASHTRWGLSGGDSSWAKNLPTIEITMDRELRATGWVTATSDPNSDNLGFWAASDSALTSWSYTITAKP